MWKSFACSAEVGYYLDLVHLKGGGSRRINARPATPIPSDHHVKNHHRRIADPSAVVVSTARRLSRRRRQAQGSSERDAASCVDLVATWIRGTIDASRRRRQAQAVERARLSTTAGSQLHLEGRSENPESGSHNHCWGSTWAVRFARPVSGSRHLPSVGSGRKKS